MPKIRVFLQLDSMSCVKISALRQHHGQQEAFMVRLHRKMADKAYNLDLLARKLPGLVATQAPFPVHFCSPHLVTKTKLKAVRYHIESNALKNFRREFNKQFADALVHESGWTGEKHLLSLREDRKLHALQAECLSPISVAVKNRIEDLDEATRIYNEILEIDPKSLGSLEVIGLRVEQESLPTASDPRHIVKKTMFPFRGKPIGNPASGS